jgi:uncharacterized RDD family membrane protein YckC
MKFKKVSGERVLAALLDYVFMYIIGLIVSIVPIIFIGFDSFIDSLFSTTAAATGEMSQEFILYTAITVYSGVVAGIIYFVVVPWKWNGQTIGKRIIKIKAVNEYGENPSFMQHFFRAIQNWTVYYSALITWVIFVNYWTFTILSLLSLIVSLIFLISFILILAREDGRGIHDMLTGTYVIKADENLDKDFVEATSQMGDWIEVEDADDDGFMEEKKKDDEWDF